MKRIIIEESVISGIPVLTMAKENISNSPAVIFVHGFTGDKRQGIELGYMLADMGFYFISLDAHMHGERFDKRLSDTWTSGKTIFPTEARIDMYVTMYQIIEQTAKDVDTLIEYFGEEGIIDKNRIGITGLSMGANTAFNVAASNPKIKVAVSMLGYPAIYERWEHVLGKAMMNNEWYEILEQMPEQLEKSSSFIQSVDPYEKMISFFPKPLLMLCGDKDISCPKEYCIKLYKKLKPIYSDYSDRLQIKIHDVDHRMTYGIEMDCSKWFKKYLMA